MKKFLSVMLVFALAFAVVGCKPKEVDVETTLVVGTTTEPGVNMFGTFWGNNASNADVRELTFGYGTVSFTKEGKYAVDPTSVKSLVETENTDGSKTYTIEINTGLVWNDGEPVTAKDYVFAVLLNINPIFSSVVGKSLSTDGTIVGSKDFNDPDVNTDGKAELPGLDLINDYKFSVTIGAENFPYYYEFLYYSFTPYPLHVLAPEADVVQGTEGAKMSGVFTSAVLEDTVDDGETGYRYDISVTCGPYDLFDFDVETSTATLKRNPLFKGDYTGQVPDIDNVVIKYVPNSVLLQSLVNGEIDLIESVSGGANIQDGLSEVAYGKIKFTTFPRNGYGLIAFHCDEPAGPTSQLEVRQAIAYLINRDLFLQTYTLGYGVLPNGEYGLSQWMVAASSNEDGVVMGKNADGELVALESYSYNPTKAVQLLEAAGWTKNATGGAYVQAEGAVRYNADGEKLEIPWANTPDNPVSELIRTQLLPNAAAVGMSFIDTTMDFNTMLYTHYYGAYGDGYGLPTQDDDGNWLVPEYEAEETDAREYHMVNLGTGFNPGLYEPYYDVSVEYWGWDGGANISYLYDADLLEAAKDMKFAADDDEYLDAWQRYQYRFNQLLPSLPLYSDMYHAFFTTKLSDYEVTPEWTMTSAILYAKMEEVAE